MTIFSEDDLADSPVLRGWSIFVGEQSQVLLAGQHAFHEGVRTAIERVLLVDPLLRWAITVQGAYRLSGNIDSLQVAQFGVNRKVQ